ncbi:MAG: carbon-nitrogen hydrolase family protein [Caulobacterales bacterium]|nr:carbon-nitrogen hydrolase family protein [Caulobacterales bacterium]
MTNLRVALIQTRTPATPLAAQTHLQPLMAEAVAGGAELILTPEASNFMERRSDRKTAILAGADKDIVIQGVRTAARESGVWILLGSAMVRSGDPDDGRAANRSILINKQGSVESTYDKLHVFDVDLPNGERYRESAGVRPGDRAVVAETPWGGLGLTVCYDLRFPQLFRALAQAGADFIAVPAAFTRPTGEAHWETLLRARAIETGCFVLAPAQGGSHEDGRTTWGRSMVVDPWGAVVAAFDHDQPGVLFADLDLTAVTRARTAIPSLRHDRDFAGPEPFR